MAGKKGEQIKKSGKMSVRAFARQLLLNEAAVRLAIKTGKIVKGYDEKTKKIDFEVAKKEWGFIHEKPRKRQGITAAKLKEKEKAYKEKVTGVAADPGDDVFVEKDNYTYEELLKLLTITPNLTYEERLKRKEIIEIALQKIKLEELQGLLVRKADVDRALYAAGSAFKKALMSVPARCISMVRAAQTEVEAINILINEFSYVLSHLPEELKLRK